MIVTEPLAQAATRPSTRRDRIAALTVALCLIGFAVGISLSGHVGLAYSLLFFAAYVTALTLSSLFAALLLIFRARLIGDRSSALLAASFVFCVPLIAAYALTFPGLVPALHVRSDASGWMSFAWRIGWPIALTWYALRPPAARGHLGRSLAVALLFSGGAIALACSGLAPPLYRPGGGTSFNSVVYAANLVTVLCAVIAIVCLVRRKPQTAIDMWVAVTICVLMMASVLIVFINTRFSSIAETVRLSNLAMSLILTCSLLYEFQRLLWRSSSLDRYLSMAQYSSSIVYLLDAAGSCIYVNQRWTDVTGQSAQDALGEGWRAVIHPDDLRDAPWTGPISALRPHDVEVRYRCAEGGYRWHLATATPTLDDNGQVDGWFGTALDVDTQHRQSDQLKSMYAREHEITETLQSAFIPPLLPHVDGIAFHAVYRPALREAEVGGDWYDAFALPDGRIALSVGDVAGHGIDAALAMVRLRETLRAVTGLVDLDPGAVLRMCDRAFAATHPHGLATAAFAVYDPQSRRLEYARAGHPAAALVRDGRATFLGAHAGLPFGVTSDADYLAESYQLVPGDMLVLYTDGLLEIDGDIVEGERRFLAMLERFPHDVELVVDETIAGGQQHDDIALLQLAVLSGTQTSWHFVADDAASASDARVAFVGHLSRRGLDPDAIAVAELAFGELVSNVVRHAPGPIEVELLEGDERWQLVVRDRGPRFTVSEIALPEDPFSEGGRGFYLMNLFASAPVVRPRAGGGNEVAVSLRTPAYSGAPPG